MNYIPTIIANIPDPEERQRALLRFQALVRYHTGLYQYHRWQLQAVYSQYR